jgi:hypothetical protein
MESTDSSTGSQQPNLPPGFRFHPTDEELVVHYLKKKAASAPLPVAIIAEVDLYKFDPWELPGTSKDYKILIFTFKFKMGFFCFIIFVVSLFVLMIRGRISHIYFLSVILFFYV